MRLDLWKCGQRLFDQALRSVKGGAESVQRYAWWDWEGEVSVADTVSVKVQSCNWRRCLLHGESGMQSGVKQKP